MNDSTTHPGTQISTQEPSTHNLLSSFRFLKISTLCLFFPHITFLRVCSSPTPALTPFSLGPCVVVAKYQSDLFLPKVSNHSKVPLLWELLKWSRRPYGGPSLASSCTLPLLAPCPPVTWAFFQTRSHHALSLHKASAHPLLIFTGLAPVMFQLTSLPQGDLPRYTHMSLLEVLVELATFEILYPLGWLLHVYLLHRSPTPWAWSHVLLAIVFPGPGASPGHSKCLNMYWMSEVGRQV